MPSARAFASADGSGLEPWASGLGVACPSPEPRVPSPSATNGAAAASATRSANSRRVMLLSMTSLRTALKEQAFAPWCPILKDGLAPALVYHRPHEQAGRGHPHLVFRGLRPRHERSGAVLGVDQRSEQPETARQEKHVDHPLLREGVHGVRPGSLVADRVVAARHPVELVRGV